MAEVEQICARSDCRKPLALWWNSSTRKYYCQSCAFKINDFNPGLCMKLTPRSERPRELP